MTQTRIANEVEEMFNSNGCSIQSLRLNNFSFATMSALLQTFFNTLISDELCLEKGLEKGSWKSLSFDEIFQFWLDSLADQTFDEEGASKVTSLVIFVFDFETINKQHLASLILILKEYVKSVSIIFVFLLSNQLNNSIQYFLPAFATDNLIIEDIQPFYETKYIPQLLKELIVDEEIQFKIHPDLVSEIHSYFTSYEFSFSNFLTFLKSIAFDHFYNNPLSAVYQIDDLKKTLNFNPNLLNIFKNSLQLSEDASNDDDVYAQLLIHQFEELLNKHNLFVFYLELLIDLHSRCVCQTKGFMELYCEMVKDAKYDFKEHFLNDLLKVKESVWSSAIRKVIFKYENNADKLVVTLKLYEEKLKGILEKEIEEEEKQVASSKKLNLEVDMKIEVKIVKDKLRNLNSRSEWRQSLAPKADSKHLLPFDQWKADLTNAIHAILEDSTPAHDRKLMDSLFYNNLDFVRRHNFVSIRGDLDHSLGSSKRSFKNIYPNSFIMYQQYKDSSPVINLKDWFEQFSEEKKHNRKCLSKNELIAHFSSTLSDFEFIGLLQSSKYKADYLNKLAWF